MFIDLYMYTYMRAAAFRGWCSRSPRSLSATPTL